MNSINSFMSIPASEEFLYQMSVKYINLKKIKYLKRF